MPSKAAYRDKTRKLVYPLSADHDEDLIVHFYPNRITPNWVSAFATLEELPEREQLPALCAKFVSVTASWNMTETDEPGADTLPLTADEVADFGLPTIRDLLKRYVQDVQSPEEAAATREPSPPPLELVRRGSMAR